ncbi:4'-phosphopantetheinyl transferase family protein [Rhizobium sp. NPDC090279]|uniref:4'-phosphopantetheinyl transferase family protein n=1 Tax=Rhizobium sp. NPDC090279 TaxID=3364499 RepID=UPI00383A3454
MRGPNGKPFVPDGPHFNLSHSAGMALLAVSDGGPVGIDLEIEGHGRNLAAAAALTLAPAEQSCFEAATPEDQGRLLRRAWVRKEAVLKAVGCGLRADPRSLIVGLDSDIRRRVPFAGSDYSIEDIALPFPAAVAGATDFVVTMSEFATDACCCPGWEGSDR